jgi:cysteine desulfurase
MVCARVHCGAGFYIGAAREQAIGRNPAVLSNSERLYLDHAATTPVLPEARAAIASALDSWANPSSPHADGRRARALLEEARATIAEVLGWRHDVIFTSGASEAVEIAAARVLVPEPARNGTALDGHPGLVRRAGRRGRP